MNEGVVILKEITNNQQQTLTGLSQAQSAAYAKNYEYPNQKGSILDALTVNDCCNWFSA